MLPNLPADLMFLKDAFKKVYKMPSHELIPESDEVAKIVLRPFKEHLESFDLERQEHEYDRIKQLLEQWTAQLNPPYDPADFVSDYISLLNYEDVLDSWKFLDEPIQPVRRVPNTFANKVAIEFDPPKGFVISPSREEDTVLYCRGREEITIYVIPGGRRLASQHNPQAELSRLKRNPNSPRFEFQNFESGNVSGSRRRRDVHVDYELSTPGGDVDVSIYANGKKIGGLIEEVEATLSTLTRTT